LVMEKEEEEEGCQEGCSRLIVLFVCFFVSLWA
jgi:hypothetical protein